MVCISDTVDSNSVFNIAFTKKGRRFVSNVLNNIYHSNNSQTYFCLQDFIRIIRLLLATVSVNGLKACPLKKTLNPSNAKATFVQSTVALAEYSQRRFLHNFVLAKLATSSIRVNHSTCHILRCTIRKRPLFSILIPGEFAKMNKHH